VTVVLAWLRVVMLVVVADWLRRTLRDRDIATLSRTISYDGGAPDERGAESADGRRPQNLI